MHRALRPFGLPASFALTIAIAVVLTFAFTAAPLGGVARAAEFDFAWALPTPQGNSLEGLAFETDSIGLAVGARGAVVRTTDGGVTWTDISDFGAFAARLTDLVSLGAGSWLAVGENPGVFRSDDGGFTWSPVTNPSSATLHDVEHAAGSTFVAIGDAGAVLRSTNGGASWTTAVSAGPQPLREQHWFDANDGIVVGDHLARRTTNGGASWSALPGIDDSQDFFNEIVEAAPGVLYTFADFRFGRTTNGGVSWEWIFDPVFPVYRAKTVAFGPQHLLLSTDVEGAEIWETTNGGTDWEPRLQRFDLGGFHELLQLPSGTLVATTTEGDLFRSTDDGLSWTNAASTPGDEPRSEINAFARLPGGALFAGSTSGGSWAPRWLKSTDAGASWFEPPTRPGTLTVEDIAFWDDSNGIVADSVNSVSWTSDGGSTWSNALLPNAVTNGVRAYTLAIPAPGVAFCAADGQNGAFVFRSTDFGRTWEQRSSGIPTSTAWLGSVSFLDAAIGYAAGGTTNVAQMWKTTNGGGSWVSVGTGGLPNFVNGLHWFNESTGLVAIANSALGLYRTTNGGGSWQAVSDASARRVRFAGNFGVACAGGFTFGHVFVSDDAGATWETVQLPGDRAGTCVFPDANGFLVGGAAAQILRATRLEATDAPIVTSPGLPTPGAADFPMTLVAAPNVGTRFELRLSAERAADYALDIIDVAGRRVHSLGAGRCETGDRATFVWDGRNADARLVAPGVYFARLATAGSVRAATLRLVR